MGMSDLTYQVDTGAKITLIN